jgi:hypothetical protein
MSNCCVNSVPQADSSFQTFAAPVADWTARLTAGLTRSMRARNQTLGHLEEEILQQTRGLERKLLEEAAQKKADQSPPVCPVCGHKLTRQTRDQERTYQTRFGPVTIRRLRGWCRRCRAWRFPADRALGPRSFVLKCSWVNEGEALAGMGMEAFADFWQGTVGEVIGQHGQQRVADQGEVGQEV